LKFENNPDNPMQHPDEQQVVNVGSPRFGRLLVILLVIVLLSALLAMSAQTYFI